MLAEPTHASTYRQSGGLYGRARTQGRAATRRECLLVALS